MEPARSKVPAFIVTGLLIALLAACSPRSSTINQTAPPQPDLPATATAELSTPTASATVAPSPTPTLTPAVNMEPWRPTIGTITETGLGRTILLVEYPENPNNGEQIIVTVLDDARISELMAGGSTPATFGDLRTGMRVAVILVGALATSYPAQGAAGEIIILRTETAGPPDLQDTVTMEFEFHLNTGYPPNRSLSSSDDFLVSYEITGGKVGDSYFCGNALEAPQPCSGSAAYNLLVEVPRGAELRYEIKRLPEGDPNQAEIFESGREIMDIDLTTRSHYRYGAPNPGGYD